MGRAEGPRAWARDGPETQMLKEAKVELADLSLCLDEARMRERKIMWKLQQELEAEQREFEILQQRQKELSQRPPEEAAESEAWSLTRFSSFFSRVASSDHIGMAR